MSTSTLAAESAAAGPAVRGLRPAVVALVGFGGGVAALWSIRLAFTSDHVDEPEVQAALMTWMVLT